MTLAGLLTTLVLTQLLALGLASARGVLDAHKPIALVAHGEEASGTLFYTMLPGQTFTTYPDSQVWFMSTWGGECVVKTDPAPDLCPGEAENPLLVGTCSPYAVLHLDPLDCPIGKVFDRDAAVELEDGWMPFSPVGPPKTHVYDGELSSSGLQKCRDNDIAVANTRLLNDMLKLLKDGDTLLIPEGLFCMAAGVQKERLKHVTIDVQGELVFGQTPEEWTLKADGSYSQAVRFEGATNVTFTSSTKSGIIRAKGCEYWYLGRAIGKIGGGNDLFYVGPDPSLTFASSLIVMENLQFYDGPNWQVNYVKVVNLIVRHTKVHITCVPDLGQLTNLLGAIALETDGIDVWGTNVHIHDVDIQNGDDCICVKGQATDDNSGINSENWLVENSTASGEGLTIGTMWSGSHITRNVTFRNIVMDKTRKAIYMKIDTGTNSATDILYQNITVLGPTMQFPVFIGANHQFGNPGQPDTGGCSWSWPYLESGTCSANAQSHTDVIIDGLHIVRPEGLLGFKADFVIIGNENSVTNVHLKNIRVEGDSPLQSCDNPPFVPFREELNTAICDNACFAANVTSDGSYSLKCTNSMNKVPSGECAPLMGSVPQRCMNGTSEENPLCLSGLKCA